MLSPEIQAEILSKYFGQGLTVRAIARELGVSRKAVSRVLAHRTVQLAPKKRASPASSILDPYKTAIREKLLRDPAMPATAIHQSLRRMGFTGSIRRLQEYIATVRVDPKPKEAFLKLSFEPGEAAQVDWGEFGDVFGDSGQIHAFVMVLCFSRKIYVEFTRSEKFEDFIRCHERAFEFFGGLRPAEIWYDNLATAVTERMGKLVRFNARFRAYAGHQGFTPYACTPASGNEKGRVEDGVKYIRSNFWPDRAFRDFQDLTAQCGDWVVNIANLREHRSTHKIPELHFEHDEKRFLRPVNPHPFDTDEVLSKQVPPQFHITYETNQYSVPWTLVAMVVTLRANDKTIRFFYGGKPIAEHVRSYLKHRVFTVDEHQEGLLERKGGADHSWQVALIKRSGESLEKYLRCVTSGHRSLRSEVKRLVALITVYGAESVNAAAAALLVRGVVGADNLEMQLKAGAAAPKAPEPIQFQNPRLNRMTGEPDLSQYDALLMGDKTNLPPETANTAAEEEKTHVDDLDE